MSGKEMLESDRVTSGSGPLLSPEGWSHHHPHRSRGLNRGAWSGKCHHAYPAKEVGDGVEERALEEGSPLTCTLQQGSSVLSSGEQRSRPQRPPGEGCSEPQVVILDWRVRSRNGGAVAFGLAVRGGALEMMDPPGHSSGGERLTLKWVSVGADSATHSVLRSTIIRRSQTPLKTLSLRGCPLKEKDLKHLSLCPSTDQLKCLDLSSFSMKDISPEPLRVLLEKVAHTLETLVLEFCEITESQLNAISPALGHCSQLKTFSFCGNQIPLTALKNVLSHTASLPLEQAKYPAPLESFDEILWGFWTEINPMKFDQVEKELMQLVKDIRPVHDIQIYSYDCVVHLKHTDFIA
ncbi:Hypothetical predicted protein [Marmota monax]|uniref:Uncharacterized protein n=1 Tax=Marmota monax TaxID=9995 RepID=A0A5E4D8G5_MARMO|nr:Hypothetical predicted protein [Marmota monax]